MARLHDADSTDFSRNCVMAARSPGLSGMDRWVAHPEALARVGANGAQRGLSLAQTLDEFAWSLRGGLVPGRLDRFAVGREIVSGWTHARRHCADPASSVGGVASSSYLRTRVHELYRPRSSRVHALVVVRARNVAALDTTSLGASGELCEHGPGVRIGIVERSAAPLVAADSRRANPRARVWVEALPTSPRHVDRLLTELRGGPPSIPVDEDVARRSGPRWSPQWCNDPASSRVPSEAFELIALLGECADDAGRLAAATQRYGEARRQTRVTYSESLAEVGALVDAIVGTPGGFRTNLDSIETVANLIRPWTLNGADHDEAAAGLIDPLTGLPGRAYLRRRIRELCRDRNAPSVRMVTIRQTLPSGDIDGLVRRIRTAEFVRHLFRDADSVAVASEASFAAIVGARDVEPLVARCLRRPDVLTARAFRLVPDLEAMGT